MDDWQARNDIQVLMEAEKIKADSNRLAAVQREAENQKKILSAVSGLGEDVKYTQTADGSIVPNFSKGA
jgi:hypothetical protein